VVGDTGFEPVTSRL